MVDNYHITISCIPAGHYDDPCASCLNLGPCGSNDIRPSMHALIMINWMYPPTKGVADFIKSRQWPCRDCTTYPSGTRCLKFTDRISQGI